jgi:hypothetical protein
MTLSLLTFGVGLISGMYIVTQIEKGINRNIKKNK